MVEKAINNGGVLSAEQVKSRQARSMAHDFCFISLRPLTDEDRFTVVGHNVQFNIHKQYGEEVMKAMNK
jgi:hypothetical protein